MRFPHYILILSLGSLGCQNDKDNFGKGGTSSSSTASGIAGSGATSGSGSHGDPFGYGDFDGSLGLACTSGSWQEVTNQGHFSDWAYPDDDTSGIECFCEFYVDTGPLVLIEKFQVYGDNVNGTPWDIYVEDNSTCEGPNDDYYGYQTNTSAFLMSVEGGMPDDSIPHVENDGMYWVASWDNATLGYPHMLEGNYRIFTTFETQGEEDESSGWSCTDLNWPVYWGIEGEVAPSDAECGERYNEGDAEVGESYEGTLEDLLESLSWDNPFRVWASQYNQAVRVTVLGGDYKQLRVTALGLDAQYINLVPTQNPNLYRIDTESEFYSATGYVELRDNEIIGSLSNGHLSIFDQSIRIPRMDARLHRSGGMYQQ